MPLQPTICAFLFPACVLMSHLLLQMPIQLRQQGTVGASRTLGAGERRAVHWPDASGPLTLNVRIQQPGWSWSGGIALDNPASGDLIAKVRQR